MTIKCCCRSAYQTAIRWALVAAFGLGGMMGPAIAAEPAGVVGCDARQQVRSGRGGNSINLEFQNRRSESVKIFWINAEGQEQEYGDVPSGFKYKQATSSDHVWMITDGEGGCIDIIRLEDLSTRASVIVIIDQTGVKI